MKSKITLLLFTLFLGFAPSSFAQPANDNACDAIELPVDGSIGNFTNVAATAQTGEVVPDATGCQEQDGWCNSNLNFSVWFKFIAPLSGQVTATTCLTGSYDTQLAIWEASSCDDFTTYSLVGANDDTPGGCDAATYASFITVGSLTVGNTYYVQVDSYTQDTLSVDSFNIQLTDGVPPPPTKIKIIHNSADEALSTVDVRINGAFADNEFFSYLDDMDFRTSSDFFTVATDSLVSITINPSGSIDDSAPLKIFTLSFSPGNHILVLDGIYSSSGYTPDNVDKPLSLFEYANAYENSNFTEFDTAHVLVHHGATDAPAVDAVVIDPNLGTIIDGIGYSEFSPYFNLLDNTNYTIEIRTDDGDALVNTYIAPAQSNFWGGNGFTIVASGFLDPTLNSDGASFGLWAAGPYGGNLIPLQTLGNFEYDNVCDAAEVLVGGSISLSNTGLTVEDGEPAPAGGSCYTTSTWCENTLSNTIWMKFVAPLSGDVTITTCSEETSFSTQIAVYSGTCDDFGTFSLVGANDDIDFNDPDQCTVGSFGASRLPLCSLVPNATYFVQLDGSYAGYGSFNLSIEEGATCKARVKVIHNSADLAAAVVDIRIDGLFPDEGDFNPYFDDMEFRSSTDFITVDAETPITITVNAADSEDDSDPLFTKIVTLAPNTSNIVIVEGIISTSGYVYPSSFDLEVVTNGREGSSSFLETDILFYNGSTDAPTVDINELITPLPLLVEDLVYGFNDGYATLVTSDDYLLQIAVANTPIYLDTIQAALTSYNLDGAAITLCASGFYDPAANSDGAELGWWFANSFGGEMQQFISPLENDKPCDAITLTADGSIYEGNNTGATVDTLEVAPPDGDCADQGAWCNSDLSNSVWYKFVAPSEGVLVSTCNEGSFLDTQIAIWEYSFCEDYTTYSLKGANDDAGFDENFDPICSSDSSTSVASIAQACFLNVGETYLVQVDGYSSFSVGSFKIAITPLVCVVGINEIEKISNFKIYPNPSNGNEVTIEYNATRGNGNFTSIEIVDITGKAVNTYNYKNLAIGNFKQQLDVTNLSNGLYFVNIISDGKIASNKLQIVR
jgi:Secretion system C-terminal sorting domain